MTALDDAIAKADEVLVQHDDLPPRLESLADANERYRGTQVAVAALRDAATEIRRLRTAAPDLARALKAVAEALEDLGRANAAGRGPLSVDNIRAAIERRLKEGK